MPTRLKFPISNGFTLIEILVAITLISTVFSTGIFLNTVSSINKAKDSQRVRDLDTIKKAIELYYSDTNCYPATASPVDPKSQAFLDALAGGGEWKDPATDAVYIKKFPKDPSNTSYVYKTDTTSCPQWMILSGQLSRAPTSFQPCNLPSYVTSNTSCMAVFNTSTVCASSGSITCNAPTPTVTPTPIAGISPTSTPVPGSPTVTTVAATSITTTTATLNSIINSGGNRTNYWWQYGTTNGTCSSLPSFTTTGSINTGSTSPSLGVLGLSFNSTYYFCAVAQNSQGIVYGNVLSFQTLVPTPTPTTIIAATSTPTPTTAPIICQGPLGPATTTDDASIGNWGWSTGSNTLHIQDNDFATAGPGPGQPTHYLKGTNFGFTIPSGTVINAIRMDFRRSASDANVVQDNAVRIIKAGVIGSQVQSLHTSFWPGGGVFAYDTYGNQTNDLWGNTWTYSDINAANFGAAISAKTTTAPEAYLEHMRITVCYSAAAPTSTPTPTNTPTPTPTNTPTPTPTNTPTPTPTPSAVLLVLDADQDGYYTGSQVSQTTTGSTVVSGRTYYSTTTSSGLFTYLNIGSAIGGNDCLDSDATKYQNLTGYSDADLDTYTIGASQQVCSGASLPSGYLAAASGTSDCYDLNANAKPGQTLYFTANRGDSSFDYDCSGAPTFQFTYYTVGSNTYQKSGSCINLGASTHNIVVNAGVSCGASVCVINSGQSKTLGANFYSNAACTTSVAGWTTLACSSQTPACR